MNRAAPVTIVEGTIADLDAVMHVMETSFDPCFGEAWTASQCAGLMPMPGVWLSLAKAGDEVVGFALSRKVVHEAELLLLAVTKEWQANGVGRGLVCDFLRVAQRSGADKLHLEVREGNPAVKLYNSLGFTEVGRRKKYYTGRDGQIYDAITLSRLIDV